MEIYGFTLSAADLWLLGICGALIMALIGYRLVLNVQKYNAFNAAAITFRGKVLAELQGIYPIPSVWQLQDYSHFRRSINKVETAAAEFRHLVKRKTEFDIAIKEYREYCKKVTFEGVSAWFTYTSTRSPDDIGPMETFKNIVEYLFSFADEK